MVWVDFLNSNIIFHPISVLTDTECYYLTLDLLPHHSAKFFVFITLPSTLLPLHFNLSSVSFKHSLTPCWLSVPSFTHTVFSIIPPTLSSIYTSTHAVSSTLPPTLTSVHFHRRSLLSTFPSKLSSLYTFTLPLFHLHIHLRSVPETNIHLASGWMHGEQPCIQPDGWWIFVASLRTVQGPSSESLRESEH